MNVPCVMLIGLPGTGKSECAKLAAELLGWSFADTDEWIVSAYGASVTALFAWEGEPFFRELERIVLQLLANDSPDLNISSSQSESLVDPQEVCRCLKEIIEKAKQNAETKGGLVLATGGGMPVPDENQKMIKVIGLSYYLACDPDVLSERLIGDTTRPLLQSAGIDDKNGKAEKDDKNTTGSQKDSTRARAIAATRNRIQELLDARRTAYGIAEEEIDTTFMTTAQVADKLKESILAKISM